MKRNEQARMQGAFWVASETTYCLENHDQNDMKMDTPKNITS